METDKDTIAAISTPPGMGGIGIVRLSGPDAVGIVQRMFVPASAVVGGKYKSHRIIYGQVVNPVDSAVVDEALVSVMLAPKTYTREDVAEINCHGGPVAVKKTLELALLAGARLAEPGEFTRRAFMNGRIDLTQAEAVMDLIASKTEASLAAAVGQLRGGLKEDVEEIREVVVKLLALTELSIDFSEEDVDAAPASELRALGVSALDKIKKLLGTYEEGRILREGLALAIVGRPNVGKSSLLNRLAGKERAIVTDVPGTTRDTVEEFINVGGLPVVVIDTAGIRESSDAIEREGVRRSIEALQKADLALLVIDGSAPLTGEDMALIDRVRGAGGGRGAAFIPVVNKSDLPPTRNVMDGLGLGELFGDEKPVLISAKTGAGMEELVGRVREKVLKGGHERTPGAAINLRHKAALAKASEALSRYGRGVDESLSPEFLALELREALDAVGEVVGATTPEDVLNRIFNEFCIGK